ncbi:MAG: tRNA pseudouridine(38-40) synthase TruA [Chitinophagaceae bacterium]|nr:tRNA pseudouridine(38-40) synthase TruA [Chitinophagaceae bacterium]HQV06985.1 tRNA pseudouridine(38-40) synthase TruA [Chitinophagaceae bacterium]
MSRYFLELAYKGTNFSGFQTQKNANTIQAEIEKAFHTLQKEKIEMTGSSRTDAGVHALQNFFHFDFLKNIHPHFVYKMNAILPPDIVVKSIQKVSPESHCRFDAVSRQYNYHIYRYKDPFLRETAFYFPYTLNISLLQEAATLLLQYTDFTSFSKRNTQVKSFQCTIHQSRWIDNGHTLQYEVIANRFLRGMVKALTATMLEVGKEKITLSEFQNIIEAKDCTRAKFAVPSHGLFLTGVNFKPGILREKN